jgi:hypothetical protein
MVSVPASQQGYVFQQNEIHAEELCYFDVVSEVQGGRVFGC